MISIKRVVLEISRPVTLAVCLLTSTTLCAQIGTGGEEIWVDGPATVRPGIPSSPDVGVDSIGVATYVWAVGSGSSSGDIFMRQFDAGNNPLNDPVQVNTSSDNRIISPRVAVAADGAFMVIWLSREPDPTAGGTLFLWVRGQAYDNLGMPLGPERLVSQLSTRNTAGVTGDLAALAGGGYVATWRSSQSSEGDSTSIQARVLNADGSPDGDQFQANEGPPAFSSNESDETVVGLKDGGFLVAWITPDIQGRTFAGDGTPRAGQFQISTNLDGSKFKPDLAVADNGNVFEVWQDSEQVGDGTEIRGRVFTPDMSVPGLSPLGDDFRVNSLIVEDQFDPAVSNFGLEGFLVVWTSDTSVGPDVDGRSTQGRIVTSQGQFGGIQQQLNIFPGTSEDDPAAGGRNGQVAVAWRAGENAEQNSAVIVGQVWFGDTLFSDSFEGG